VKDLGPHDLHLWHANADMPPDAALAQLQPQERERARRFVFERDRARHLATRWLVRRVLSRYAPVAAADWRFGANAHGRPHIDAPALGEPLHFSLSHSEEAVLLLVGRQAELGVDVEGHRAGDADAIALQVFAPAERAWLHASPDAEGQRFLTLWTLKEAYIKARGQGLSMPLQRFALLPEGSDGARLQAGPEIDADAAGWRFWRGTLRPGLPWAVAVRDGRARLRVFDAAG